MSNAVNKKKFNHQKAKRVQSRSVKKTRLAHRERSVKAPTGAAAMRKVDGGITSATRSSSLSPTPSLAALPLTEHHRKALKSNPSAPTQLSKKKEKRLRKLARITQLLDQHNGDEDEQIGRRQMQE